MIKMLIEACSKVNAQNREGRTALHVATRLGNIEIVKELVKGGARVNAETEDYKTSLHVASWKGHDDIVKYLISSGADVNRADMDGTTAMHWAAKHNKNDLIEYLIDSGAKVSLGDKLKRGPIHEAALRGNTEAVQLLLKHGARLDQRTKDGSSLVSYILDKSQHFTEDLTELLLIAGANPHGIFSTIMPRDSLETKRIKGVILNFQYSVPSLMNISRVYIRRQLSEANRGRSIIKDIAELPLPNLMKDFILLKPDLDKFEERDNVHLNVEVDQDCGEIVCDDDDFDDEL
ncbi:26S proteasome non-ATPase regulatory subunit 10-like [Lineus longissimus]|uniref:26S proteasome non-ATPase regulatory subunit 10-like n=1 Tax=Lineus longissimus TaxID=88925 RepID=UPI002B4C6905